MFLTEFKGSVFLKTAGMLGMPGPNHEYEIVDHHKTLG